MTTATETKTLKFSLVAALALGASLDGGDYAGITTLSDGRPVAIVHLGLTLASDHAGCVKYAEEHDAEIASRAVFHTLRATIKDKLPKEGWCWTADTLDQDTGKKADASYAWLCYFRNGLTSTSHKSYERQAVVVRLIPLEA